MEKCPAPQQSCGLIKVRFAVRGLVFKHITPEVSPLEFEMGICKLYIIFS